MSLTLYSAPMSSATVVVCALAELGVDYDTVQLDLSAGDQKRPDYLALNPHGVVPTLVVDGVPMFETIAILQWLADRYGVERDLWPAADRPERLIALSWTSWVYVSYGMLINALNFAQSPNVDTALHHPPLATEAMQRLDAALDRLDAHLAEHPYLLGDTYSLADLIVACVVVYSTYCGVSVEQHPHVQSWLQRFQLREAYATAWAAPPPA